MGVRANGRRWPLGWAYVQWEDELEVEPFCIAKAFASTSHSEAMIVKLGFKIILLTTGATGTEQDQELNILVELTHSEKRD